MENEYRVVCKYHPTDGHQRHEWTKLSVASAEQSRIDMNHKADVNPNFFYRTCAPFRVQSRPIVDWEDVE